MDVENQLSLPPTQIDTPTVFIGLRSRLKGQLQGLINPDKGFLDLTELSSLNSTAPSPDLMGEPLPKSNDVNLMEVIDTFGNTQTPHLESPLLESLL